MIVFEKPKALTDAPLHYCPGCTHGIVHRLVAEVMDELGIEGKTVGVAPVGCSVLAYNYFACDMVEAARMYKKVMTSQNADKEAVSGAKTRFKEVSSKLTFTQKMFL